MDKEQFSKLLLEEIENGRSLTSLISDCTGGRAMQFDTASQNKYGALVMRAVNYILDDEEAFKKFLHDGRIEMHNNAVESVFRHIAMGRRCWLNSGSHDAAQNIAFMYSLYESCKMNDIDFGEYVEDILTRMMNGDDDYRSMIPCYYTPGKKQEKKVA